MLAALLLSLIYAAVALSDDDRRRCARVFRAPFDHLHRTMDAAAREAEKDRAQFTRQMEGAEGSLPSLWKQGAGYLAWLGVELIREFGLPKEVELAATARRRIRRAGLLTERKAS